jgi:hypothetical protein
MCCTAQKLKPAENRCFLCLGSRVQHFFAFLGPALPYRLLHGRAAPALSLWGGLHVKLFSLRGMMTAPLLSLFKGFHMTVFILPSHGERTYRGKFPNRIRSSGFDRATGHHIELMNGMRLWALGPVFAIGCSDRLRDLSDVLSEAVQMTAAQYETLKQAAAIARERVNYCGHGARADIERQARDLLATIQAPADDAASDAARVAADVEADAARLSANTGARTIDATPLWADVLPILFATLERGNANAQRIARAELERMAHAADRFNALAKAQS